MFSGYSKEPEIVPCRGKIASSVLRYKLIFFNQLQIIKKNKSKYYIIFTEINC